MDTNSDDWKWLGPGTEVTRRNKPEHRGTVGFHVGYVSSDGKQVHLVWRLVHWDTGRATLVRTIDLVAVTPLEPVQASPRAPDMAWVPQSTPAVETRDLEPHRGSQVPSTPTGERGTAILRAMDDLYRQHGRPATVRELADAIGIDSTGNVSYHLADLYRRGYAYPRGGARSWYITEEGRTRLAMVGLQDARERRTHAREQAEQSYQAQKGQK